MASPVVASDFTIQNFGGDTCEMLRKLLETNNSLAEFFGWMFDANGDLTSAFKVLMQDVAVAVGVVVFRPVSSIPSGYLLCNGQAVSRTIYANLFAIFGTTFGTGDSSTTFNLPDLSGKFLTGSGPGGLKPLGSTGGADTVTLSEAQIPAHKHSPEPTEADGFLGHAVGGAPATFNVTAGGDTISMADTAATGGGQSHDNLPPYFSGHWLVKY